MAERSQAERLFGDAEGVIPAAPPQAVEDDNNQDDDDRDDDQHDDGPEHAEAKPAAARTDWDRAQVLFGGPERAAEALDLSTGLERLADLGATRERRDQEHRDFAHLALNTLGLEPYEARQLFDLIVEQVQAGNGGTELTDDNAGVEGFDERAPGWSMEARRRMREVYGDAAAEEVERNYTAFINNTPGLRERLIGGLRAHPAVMEMLVGSMRRRGKR